MRFSITNLCTESATVITASSQNANFPSSNLKNPFRSVRWRSKGNFIIDATNNKINFKEASLGSELTATLTSSTYTALTLAAEIKTQMEAVSVDTFTVTFSTATGLWSITSSGTFFSLLNSTGTNASTSVFKLALGYPNTDKTASLTYTGSLIAIHTEESVVFDIRTAQDIMNVCVMWPKEDGIKLSEDAVITLQANATNVWTSPAVSQVLTIDNDYIVASHFFATAQSYRYWRLKIVDPQNPYLYIELGHVWIGENLNIDPLQNGFKYKLVDLTKVTKTDFGHEYADEYPVQAQLDFDYKYLQYAEYKILENSFRLNGNRKPVLVAVDDQELVYDKDHFLLYGKMDKSFDGNHERYDLFNTGIKITELG